MINLIALIFIIFIELVFFFCDLYKENSSCKYIVDGVKFSSSRFVDHLIIKFEHGLLGLLEVLVLEHRVIVRVGNEFIVFHVPFLIDEVILDHFFPRKFWTFLNETLIGSVIVIDP